MFYINFIFWLHISSTDYIFLYFVYPDALGSWPGIGQRRLSTPGLAIPEK